MLKYLAVVVSLALLLNTACSTTKEQTIASDQADATTSNSHVQDCGDELVDQILCDPDYLPEGYPSFAASEKPDEPGIGEEFLGQLALGVTIFALVGLPCYLLLGAATGNGTAFCSELMEASV